MNMVDGYFISIFLILIILFTFVETILGNHTMDALGEMPINLLDNGSHVGAACVKSCNESLLHVYCNTKIGMCQCDKNYPVKLNPYVGCSKPKRLGDQCYYIETCQYTDQYSSCIQVHHNAVCQCIKGYHSVSLQKPALKMFCSKVPAKSGETAVKKNLSNSKTPLDVLEFITAVLADIVIITTDFSTFIGVIAGIAVLTGLICFTLHLFNQTLYENQHRRFGDTNLIPTTLFANNSDRLPMPMTEQSMTSRTSSRKSFTYQFQKPGSSQNSHISSPRTAAVLLLSYHVPSNEVICSKTDRKMGSRRPSYSSVHSTVSINSYSSRRLEREREQKEEKEMQRRLSKIKNDNMDTTNFSLNSPDNTLDESECEASLHLAKEESMTLREDIPSTSNQSF